jgi:hypothetical protein
VNVIVGFLIVALITCAGCYVTCAWADDTIEVAPQPQPVRRACDNTGCGYRSVITVTRRGGRTAHVCAGCHNTGELMGWWI